MSDMKYPLSFAAWFSTSLMQVLILSFLLLYITDYVETGILSDDAEASIVFSRVTTVSLVISALIIPFIGKAIDVIPTKIIFPIVFLARGLFCFQFRFV